ncbi:tRNA 2-thiouridine(34) synthase MnmA [Candidatus Kaiserbacteria bacterium]|nr:tRNA 2-thiouridine(34) synthase MnmA [Candidatus Kaiserbacteria bacterium]
MRVFVGMSGGVDSAVSAALLKQEGHDVTGVFIKIWSPEFLECTWKQDRLDALRSAVAIGIPFKEIDLSNEYRDTVIQKMIRVYESGRTPNPDVVCNETIKFGAFFRWALAAGADKVATGHYARILYNEPVHCYELHRGIDKDKDQSYFLHRLGQEELSQTVFPVGEMEKREVRQLAHTFSLSVAPRPESQGLCFVGDITLPEFLSRYIAPRHGVVVDVHGVLLGEHDGAHLFTLGQRHGMRFSAETDGKPYYVVKTDIPSNVVTVSHTREDAAKERCVLENMHWISGAIPDAEASVRYRSPGVRCHIEAIAGHSSIRFDMPQIISPGQSVVLYDGSRCLGGGIAA